MTVDRFEMKVGIDDLASYKCPGMNGVSAEHFTFAYCQTYVLRLSYISCIV